MSDENSRPEYWADLRGMAVDLIDKCRDNGQGFDLSEAVPEEVDGSSWIMWNSSAAKVMEYTNNDDALLMNMGASSLNGKTSWYEIVTAFAYCAMEADLWDTLREVAGEQPDDFDINDDTTWISLTVEEDDFAYSAEERLWWMGCEDAPAQWVTVKGIIRDTRIAADENGLRYAVECENGELVEAFENDLTDDHEEEEEE